MINIELSTVCRKACSICSRTAGLKQYPDQHMSMEVVNHIYSQLPKNNLLAMHGRGESTEHPEFNEIARLFSEKFYLVIDTNGINLLERDFSNFLTITVSIFKDDPLWEEQYEDMCEFVASQKNTRLMLRINGTVTTERYDKYYQLVGENSIVWRRLHLISGSKDYEEKFPSKPEHGICKELFDGGCIHVDGDISLCPRLDMTHSAVIGNISQMGWESAMDRKRAIILEHAKGNRDCLKVCSECDYYGIENGF